MKATVKANLNQAIRNNQELAKLGQKWLEAGNSGQYKINTVKGNPRCRWDCSFRQLRMGSMEVILTLRPI